MTIKHTALCALALAWGCGSVKTGDLPDGGGGGGGGGPDASMTGTATVTTKTHTPGFGAAGATQANVPVISLLPNGEMADMKLSDANGNATIDVYPGGSVTAVYAHKAPDQGTDFATYFGVKPSDELTFGEAFADSTPVGTMTLSWTAVAGASYYYVYYPCGFSYTATNSFVITETASCHQSSMELQVNAVASSGVPIALLSTFATFANGGSLNIGTPNAGNLAHSMAVSFTGIPAAVTFVSFSTETVLNQDLNGFQASNSGQPTGGAFSGSLTPWAQFSGDRVVAQLDLEEDTDNEEIEIFDGFSTGNLSWTVASPPAIPELPFNAALVSGSAQWAAWSTIGTQATTGTLVTSQSSRTIAGMQYPINWTFIVPPEMRQFEFPKLPAPYDKLMPTLTDLQEGSSITPFLIPSVTDYDALRGMPESAITCLTCSVAQGVFPRIVLNQVFP